MNRRRFVAAITALGVTATASAQIFGPRPITMIVPYAPGGTGEILGRLMAQEMEKLLGHNIIVDLRPGAGGNIGAEYVAKSAKPDGHTFLLAASSLATSVSLMNLRFDPRKDLAPVAGIAAIPNLLVVSASSPYKTLADLVNAGRRDPKALTYGSSGPGTGSHLAGALFSALANVPMTHVPYKGSGAVYPDLIAGRISMLFDVMGSALAQVQGGRVRALAITSSRRSPALADVPTIAESYPGYEFVTWFGFFAPAATPAAAIANLEQASAAALKTPALKERLEQLVAEPIPVPAPEFEKYFEKDVERWANLARAGKIQRIE
jgi:tripartite-type tricarboxylate transporter receptor subunit TctC